jgi:hypothetical protein
VGSRQLLDEGVEHAFYFVDLGIESLVVRIRKVAEVMRKEQLVLPR